MENNPIDKDEKILKNRGKLIKIVGIIGSIILGICNLLFILAGDFNLEALVLFCICIGMSKVK